MESTNRTCDDRGIDGGSGGEEREEWERRGCPSDEREGILERKGSSPELKTTRTKATSVEAKLFRSFLRNVALARKNYTASVDGEQLKIRYKLEGNVFNIMFEGTLHADVVVTSAIAREWDLVKIWNSMIVKSDIRKVITMLSLLVSGEIWLPWPFRNRSMALRTRGYDATKTNGLFFVNLETDHRLLKILKGDTSPIEMSGGMTLEPVRPKDTTDGSVHTRATFLVHLKENRMNMIPSWLVKAGLRVYSPRVFDALNGIVKNIYRDLKKNRALTEEENYDAEVFAERESSATAGGATTTVKTAAKRTASASVACRRSSGGDGSVIPTASLTKEFVSRIESNDAFYSGYVRRRQRLLIRRDSAGGGSSKESE